MHSSVCTCGRVLACPDISICPFCKADLSEMSEEACTKHVKKCALKSNPGVCSPKKVGRPSKKDMPVPDFLREDIPRSHRDCDNCKSCNCPKKGTACADWTPQDLRSCPFCGREIQKVVRNGVLHSIACGYCNLHMDAYDVSRGDEALISRWNGGLLKNG